MSATSLQPSTLILDPNRGFNMQAIADSLTKAYPAPSASVSVTGVYVPIICMGGCKETGIINPENDVKEVASRIYNNAMQAVYQPIWTGLYALYEALKRFGLGVIDLTLPVFGLHLSDLFNPDITCIIEKAINKLFEKFKNAYDKFLEEIQRIFNLLSIPFPLFQHLNSPEELIKYIVKHIVASLWDELMKKIKLIKDLILIGLKAYDILIYKHYTLSEVWKNLQDQILKTILHYLSAPLSLNDIKRILENYAKKILHKAEVTYAEILSVIEKIKIPIFGFPLDWKFPPLNLHINMPDLDFNKILNDIKLWLNNFVMNIIMAFIKAIQRILKIFGISIQFPKIRIPFFVCTVNQA